MTPHTDIALTRSFPMLERLRTRLHTYFVTGADCFEASNLSIFSSCSPANLIMLGLNSLSRKTYGPTVASGNAARAGPGGLSPFLIVLWPSYGPSVVQLEVNNHSRLGRPFMGIIRRLFLRAPVMARMRRQRTYVRNGKKLPLPNCALLPVFLLLDYSCLAHSARRFSSLPPRNCSSYQG